MSILGEYDVDAPELLPRDPVPPGTYTAQIEASEVTATSKNTGDILKLQWRILEGEHENRVVFDNVNLRNVNETAQKIGQSQLASIRKALGVGAVKNSEELHNIPCKITVKIRPPKDGYEASNSISKYESLNATATPPAPASKPATPPLAAAPARPWEKKK